MFRSTREVADLLGVTPGRISKAVWDGRLDPPQRGPSGAFLWTEQDVRRASWALLHRDVDAHVAEGQEWGHDLLPGQGILMNSVVIGGIFIINWQWVELPL